MTTNVRPEPGSTRPSSPPTSRPAPRAYLGHATRPALLLLLLLSACRTSAQASPPAANTPDDGDGDGWYDLIDRCPNEAGTVLGCPRIPPDLDRDSFLGRDDRCPDDPGVEPDGCPIPDSDGDGLLDPDDRCPTVPETKNGHEDYDGCPDEIQVQLAKFTGRIRGIYFDWLRTTIKPKSRVVLDRAVKVLKEFDTIRILISCHESTAPGVNNVHIPALDKFTLRRALAVKRYLVERGIDADRLEVRGAGWSEPISSNKTAAGRAQNRRCDFDVLVR